MGRIVKGTGRVIAGEVMEARGEAAALREAARREGYAAGRAEAAAEMAAVLLRARAEASRLIVGARPAALAIAGKMAERIVGRAVVLDPGVMADIAAEALAACHTPSGAVRVRVHPADLAAVEARRARLAGGLPEGAALELAADEAVQRYGCVVETPVGRVDARLDTQIAALERVLDGGDGDG
jgi:flagellar biosynthesis/type III secretory pathway protein FliH